MRQWLPADSRILLRDSRGIILRAHGFELSSVLGSHYKFLHRQLRRTVIVPHPKRDLPCLSASTRKPLHDGSARSLADRVELSSELIACAKLRRLAVLGARPGMRRVYRFDRASDRRP
jgi:predicted RNA binding protein YcfA (HicA-like mRNA interferase family)